MNIAHPEPDHRHRSERHQQHNIQKLACSELGHIGSEKYQRWEISLSEEWNTTAVSVFTFEQVTICFVSPLTQSKTPDSTVASFRLTLRQRCRKSIAFGGWQHCPQPKTTVVKPFYNSNRICRTVRQSFLSGWAGAYMGTLSEHFYFSFREREGKNRFRQTPKKRQKQYVTVAKAVCYCRKSSMLLSQKQYVTVAKKKFFGLNTWFERGKKNQYS